MRITIITSGSRGDIVPFLALGRGLCRSGYDVRLVTHADFAGLADGTGIEFVPFASEAQALHQAAEGLRMIHDSRNAFGFVRRFIEMHEPYLESMLRTSWEASRDSDLIISSLTTLFIAHAAAEARGIPLCQAYLQPSSATARYPHCLFPRVADWLPGRSLYNLTTHALAAVSYWGAQRDLINRVRKEVLGLPPIYFFGEPLRVFTSTPVLYGFSEALVPRPADWGATFHVTGYWVLDRPTTWEPPADLVHFLRSGPKPVCVGFGSMPDVDAAHLTGLVMKALDLAGQRGVLLSGWGGLNGVPRSDRVYTTNFVPHDWLYHRVSAAVHHGGAGTTAASCRAGVPTVVVPFMADQLFWGQQVQRMGVGPAPCPRRTLTPERLAAAIRQAVESPDMQTRARAVGERLRAEDGVGRAVEVISGLYGRPRPAVPPTAVPRFAVRVSLDDRVGVRG